MRRATVGALIGGVALLVMQLLSGSAGAGHAPQIEEGIEIHVEVFATTPPRSIGGSARLNAMALTGERLFVVASLDGLIYEVTGGEVKL